MFDRVELKLKAKEQIRGNLILLLMCSLIVSGASALLLFVPVIGTLASIALTPTLTVGLVLVYLNLSRGKQPDFADLFAVRKQWLKVFLLNFIVGLRIILWSMLLYVPGIIAAIRYSMVYYIFLDNPELSLDEILTMSKAMTNGHKMDIFMLGLSFVGWMFLAPFTCGLLYFWLVPYMSATIANLYGELKIDYEKSSAFSQPNAYQYTGPSY